MRQVRVLASGSRGNATLLETSEGTFLIDAGISARQITLRAQGGLDTLKAIFITHDHRDHIAGLTQLIRRHPVPVFASRETCRSLVHQTPALASRVRPLSLPARYQVYGLEIRALPTPHDTPGSCFFQLSKDGVTLTQMTDAGSVTPEMIQAIAESHILLIESNHDEDLLLSGSYPAFLKDRILGSRGHLSNLTAAATVAETHHPLLRHLVLMHLSEENNRPELARKTMETALGLTRRWVQNPPSLHVACPAGLNPILL